MNPYTDELDDDFDTTGEWKWVIPHHSSLDYCHVRILDNLPSGAVRVEGYRNHGWTPDKAHVRCQVPADKLTTIPSWHRDFLALYDDPCQPKVPA